MTLFGVFVDSATLWAIASLLLAAPTATFQAWLWHERKVLRRTPKGPRPMAVKQWQPAHLSTWRDIPVGGGK